MFSCVSDRCGGSTINGHRMLVNVFFYWESNQRRAENGWITDMMVVLDFLFLLN